MAGRTCTPIAETFMMAPRSRMRTQNAADWHEWQGACDREGVSCLGVKAKVLALANVCEMQVDLIGVLVVSGERRKRGTSTELRSSKGRARDTTKAR
jgi:hypothetical protein